MQLAVLGINHKTAPVEIRESMAFSKEQVMKALECLYEFDHIVEGVILSTCNRTEIYAVVDEEKNAKEELLHFLQYFSHTKIHEDYLFFAEDEEAVRHLFTVASSLDSLIVGEGQILSQVKQAYVRAHSQGTTGTVLNIIFQKAIAVGKMVRTETGVAGKPISVSYTAVSLAQNCIPNLDEAKVLIIGAGEMSELTASHLVAKGVKEITVANRTLAKAKELAERFGGTAVPFSEFIKTAERADILITSTGSPHYLLNDKGARSLMYKREGRPIVMIDIAVPRDIDPEVGSIEGINLFNIDALESVIEHNKQYRMEEAEKAWPLIEKALGEIKEKLSYLSVRPMMVVLSERAEQMRRREVHRIMAKLPDISDKERRLIESMSKKLVHKLLRDPMIRLYDVAGQEKENQYWELISELFNIGKREQDEYKNRDKK